MPVKRFVWSLNADESDIYDISMLVQPGSRQLPRWVEKLDGVSLCPLCKNRLLCDEAVSAVWGTLMKEVLRTLVPAAHLIVVIGNISVTLRPKGRRKKRGSNLRQVIKEELCRFYI